MAFATARMMAAEDSMPVFAAPTGKSETTAAIWEDTSSGSISWTPVTATVFCAVTAVIAERPYTPCAAKVFRSAWMPAPPPESDPAMVRADRRGGRGFDSARRLETGHREAVRKESTQTASSSHSAARGCGSRRWPCSSSISR